jgi:hypothetical protein
MRAAIFLMLFLGGAASDEALRKRLGCDDGCRLLSVESVQLRGKNDLAVRTRRNGHCGTVSDWTLLDADLKLLLTVDEVVDRSCSGHEEHRRTPVVIENGSVRAGDRVWRWDGQQFVLLPAR